MAFNFYEALTALSTAATGLLVLMQYRTQRALAAPHITGYASRVSGDELLTTIRIRPADFEIQFHKITAEGALLAAAKSDYAEGRVSYSVDGPWAKSLATPIEVLPTRFSSEATVVQFFIKPRNSSNSARISLHTRVMWLPVRYKIKAPITISS
jgi:hypothetical protein